MGVYESLSRWEPIIWDNETYAKYDGARILDPAFENAAEDWECFSIFLADLLPPKDSGRGIFSPLIDISGAEGVAPAPWRTLVKCDHELPLAGSIKARGGFYEVLSHARDLAAILEPVDSRTLGRILRSDEARKLFARHRVVVGSTGNLGFSIGMIGRALGFAVDVHMSAEAKHWKKERLRHHGVTVHEHAGDYGQAVAAARIAAERDPAVYFVDDERSERLFLGYSTAALELKNQLHDAGIEIGPENKLYVYLPCGVGGAPGGITYGLKRMFGDNAVCIFVEPTASPCMLVQLASRSTTSISVYEVGLNNATIADGLAVPVASRLVVDAVGKDISAIVTVSDEELLRSLQYAWREFSMRLEPSAAAGFAAMPRYLAENPEAASGRSTHVIWTTGGSLLPDADFAEFLSLAATAGDADNARR